MLTVLKKASITVDPEGKPLGEVVMVGQERWQEIHRPRGPPGPSVLHLAYDHDRAG
jgi:hypothetical protein